MQVARRRQRQKDILGGSTKRLSIPAASRRAASLPASRLQANLSCWPNSAARLRPNTLQMIEETHSNEQIIHIQDVTTMLVWLDELHHLLIRVRLSCLRFAFPGEVEQILVAGNTPHFVAP